jgi:hypothetical protein
VNYNTHLNKYKSVGSMTANKLDDVLRSVLKEQAFKKDTISLKDFDGGARMFIATEISKIITDSVKAELFNDIVGMIMGANPARTNESCRSLVSMLQYKVYGLVENYLNNDLRRISKQMDYERELIGRDPLSVKM